MISISADELHELVKDKLAFEVYAVHQPRYLFGYLRGDGSFTQSTTIGGKYRAVFWDQIVNVEIKIDGYGDASLLLSELGDCNLIINEMNHEFDRYTDELSSYLFTI